jgi:hypothetical protein
MRRGDIVRIDLGDGCYAYAIRLEAPLFAFFDLRSAAEVSVDEVRARPVLFAVWVMDRATRKKSWRVIGRVELDAEDPLEQVQFFQKDPITGKMRLYRNDMRGPPLTLAEAETMECAAVWDPEHVEDRLRDHFAGRPNKWVESLRPGRGEAAASQ